MNIVNYGHVRPTLLTCRGCGATLEYTPCDVKVHTNRFHVYHYVSCPVCGKWCFVEEEGVVK